MSVDQPDNAQENGAKAPSPRRLFIIAVVAAVLGLIVTLSFGYADHSPKPHGVRLAIAAPPAAEHKLAAEFAQKEPGAFTLVPVESLSAAERAVRDQSTLGAVGIGPGGPNVLVVAGAQCSLPTTVFTKVFTQVSTAMHRSLRTIDVAPLNSGDASGLGAFVFELGLLVPSVIGSVGLFLLGNRMRLWWRVLASLLFALLAACGGILAMDAIFGALSGSFLELLAVGFLGASSFILFVAAVQSFVGLPGTGLGALAFIFVGNAISGGSVPIPFLPGGFRQVAPWLPNNGVIRGVRDVVYYNGHDLGHPFLVLAIWPVAALLILFGVDKLHMRALARWPHLAQEIYSTPGVVHLRHHFKGDDAADPANLRPGAHSEVPMAVAAGTPVEPEVAVDPEVRTRELAAALAASPAATNGDPVGDMSPPPAAVAEPEPEPEPASVAPAPAEPEPEPWSNGSGPVHRLPELPANSGIPKVPDVPRSAIIEHADVTAQLVTVRAQTVIISAGAVTISEDALRSTDH